MEFLVVLLVRFYFFVVLLCCVVLPVEEFPVVNVVVGTPGSSSRNGSLREGYVEKAGACWVRGVGRCVQEEIACDSGLCCCSTRNLIGIGAINRVVN